MIKYIDFGGEKRPVKYGMNALATFSKLSKSEVKEDGSGLGFDDLRLLVYVGLQEGARADRKEFKVSLEDVGDWLDADFDKLQEFVEAFTESLPEKKK
jgi:hypothetical protein